MSPNTCSRSKGTQGLPADDARLEPRGIALDGVHHQIGHAVTMVVPRFSVGQFRRHVLAEQACDVLSRAARANRPGSTE